MWTSSVIENTHIIHEYMANSLPRDSDQMRRIQAAVKKAGMFVVLGFSERDGGEKTLRDMDLSHMHSSICSAILIVSVCRKPLHGPVVYLAGGRDRTPPKEN